MVPSEVISLALGPLRLERPRVTTRWDVLLGVVADFSLHVGARRLIYEESFPVVELVVALQGWLRDLRHGLVRSFSYESMESADGSLLDFVREGPGWAVRSRLQEYEEGRVLTTDELRGAAERFVKDVERAAASELGLDIRRWTAA